MRSLCVPVLVVLLLAAIITPLLIYVWREYDRRKRFPYDTGRRWQQSGRTVQLDPIGVLYYADRPRRAYSVVGSVFGALGVANDHLVFQGYRSILNTMQIPLNEIRSVGLSTVRVQEGKYAYQRRVLTIHRESAFGWNVYTFIATPAGASWTFSRYPEPPHQFARALAELCGVTLRDAGDQREDFGPANAIRLHQDVYGQWHEVEGEDAPPTLGERLVDLTDWNDFDDALYLAPDRLLYRWNEAIHLSQIRQVEVYAKGVFRTINPFSQDLLRIEYDADGKHFVIGFLVHRADKWGEAISERAAILFQMHEGRKKKDGDEERNL